MLQRMPLPILVGLLMGSAPHGLFAVTPQRQELTAAGTLERGRGEGISITSEATLRLAPRVREIPLHPEGRNPQSFVWCQAIDSRGRLFVGTGNEGRVFRITPAEGSRPYFQTEEIEVTALAVDEKDHLYVAASPPGRIYHVVSEAEGSLFFESEERYIWALARNSRGELYAATGDRGTLYRISREGKATLVLDSEDPHIVSLALDGEDNVYAGTAGRGIVYRIRDRGGIDVVYESGAEEVSALAVSPRGTLYIALLESRPQERKPTRRPEKEPKEREEEPLPGLPPAALREEILPVRPSTAIFPRREDLRPRRPIRSRLLALSPEGWVRTVWESEGEILYSLLFTGDAIHAGTGRVGTLASGEAADGGEAGSGAKGFGGVIRKFPRSGGSTLIARLPETQVTSLIAQEKGGLYAATSNLGNLYWIDPDLVETGTFTSVPVDAGLPSRWGRIWWRGEAPGGTGVEFSTRTGNTARSDETWSSWAVAAPEADGGPIKSPPGRYLQWRVKIRGPSVEVQEVWISFIQRNVPPVVGNLQVRSPEKRTAEGEPDTADPGKENRPEGAAGKGEPAQGLTVTWKGEDPNGDHLVYDLWVRGEGGEDWKVLAQGVEGDRYAWNTRLFPDGRYRLRIRASDAPDNPPAEAGATEALSPVFLNDHTPPEVSPLEAKVDRGLVQVEGVVTDNLAGIASLRYSLDLDHWIPVFPEDGICDSNREEIRLTLEGLPPGDHLLHLKAIDANDNVGSGKIPFTVGG